MRVILLLAMLAGIAYMTNQKWLGLLILLFIVGCALFGVGEAVFDLANGTSDLTGEGRRRNFIRHRESNPNLNPCYYNLRRRGISHEECLRRGEPPLRTDDYYEQKIA